MKPSDKTFVARFDVQPPLEGAQYHHHILLLVYWTLPTQYHHILLLLYWTLPTQYHHILLLVYWTLPSITTFCYWRVQNMREHLRLTQRSSTCHRPGPHIRVRLFHS